MVLEKSPKVPWTARRSNQSILREINPGMHIGGTDAEAEAPVFWSPDVNSQLTGKVPGTFCWEGLRAEREEGFRE